MATQIYVDKKANPKIRAQAQGFLVLVTYGVGMLIGAQITGWLKNWLVTESGTVALQQWPLFWALPAIFAGVIIIFFALLFQEQRLASETGN